MLSHPVFRALHERLSRIEIIPLLGFLVPAFLIYATIEMMDEVREGEADHIDRAILATMRAPGAPHEPIGPDWFVNSMKDITSLGSTTVLTLISASAVGFLLVSKRFRLALILALSMVAGSVLNAILKNLFERPRPEFVATGVPIDSFSFPSGHAMLSAITYLTLGALLARSEKRSAYKGYIVGLAILITLLIGSSRLYLGVHYPTDVLAGWSIGALWALGTWWIARRLSPSRTGEET